MSLFTKTVVSAGLTKRDADALQLVFEAIAERLKGHDAEIAELRAEIERLKSEPRTSLAQRIRSRGYP